MSLKSQSQSVEVFEINNVRIVNIKNDSENIYFGIACLCGSNYESPDIAGISHYIEHCCFKATTSRTWEQINRDFARLGASPNAYTSNTEVVYHASCPKNSLEGTINIMLDMFFNSTFPEDEIEKERNVIIEEKKTYEDDPRSYFYGQTGRLLSWELGHDTLGTFDTIRSIKRHNMINYLNDKINFNNFIIICCGNINKIDLVKYLKKNIPSSHSYLHKGEKNTFEGGFWSDMIKQPKKIKITVYKKNLMQSSISMFTQGLSVFDKDYFAFNVLLKAIGGGMYSKLFSQIREKLGLCYSVGMYSNILSYPDKVITELYGLISPDNIDSFMRESEKVLKDVVKNGIDKDLFTCAKMDVLSSLLRRVETSQGKASLLLNRLLYGKEGSVEGITRMVSRVNLKQCNDMVGLLDTKYNWAVMIPENT